MQVSVIRHDSTPFFRLNSNFAAMLVSLPSLASPRRIINFLLGEASSFGIQSTTFTRKSQSRSSPLTFFRSSSSPSSSSRISPMWLGIICILMVFVCLAYRSVPGVAIKMADRGAEGLRANVVNINASYSVPKIPPFWKVDPRAWSAIADLSFWV